jgi:hypothetical protein
MSTTIPSCKDCIHFVPGNTISTSQCARFHMIRGRGKLFHAWTETIRMDKTKCGPFGRYFIARPIEKPQKPDILSEDIFDCID